MEKGKIIVITGLSACGKTTLARLLCKKLSFQYIKEHKDWLDNPRIPKSPGTLIENKRKQLYFLNVFLQRQNYVNKLIDKGINVICDSDFTSALAFSYSNHFFNPHLDVYKYIAKKYIDYLDKKLLRFGDVYIYLDCSLDLG